MAAYKCHLGPRYVLWLKLCFKIRNIYKLENATKNPDCQLFLRKQISNTGPTFLGVNRCQQLSGAECRLPSGESMGSQVDADPTTGQLWGLISVATQHHALPLSPFQQGIIFLNLHLQQKLENKRQIEKDTFQEK